MPQQKLITKAIADKLPPIYGQEKVKDPIVYLKLFNPTGSGTWYITEWDGEDAFFGYTTGLGHDDLGYISKSELENLRLPMGLKIERDQWWEPTPLSKVKSGEVT
jgi:hypothetical protein